jgi:cytochrome d ubiquinol oxidase subunit II
VPAIVFGVAFGNLLQGVPFQYDDTMRVSYSGGFFGLLNPFGLTAGALSLAMLVMHGGTYLQLRTDGDILARARRYTRIAAILVIVLFVAAGVWVATSLSGYRITQMPDAGGVFTPVAKTVERAAGAWMQNYGRYPWMWLAPAAGLAGAVLALVLRGGTAFLASGLSVAGIILTAGFSMFPFVMPSSLDPRVGLTVWDAVSSHRTLQIMFWVVVIMLPVVIVYTGWVYSVLRGKVTVERVREQTHTAY